MTGEAQEQKIREILTHQPFKSITKGILKVESMYGKGGGKGISGITFKLIVSNGRKYKLNYTNDLKRAKQIEKATISIEEALHKSKLKKITPTFYGRENRFLLFEWIEGTELKENMKVSDCHRLGQMCAEVHRLNQFKKYDMDKLFIPRIKRIPNNIFSNEEKSRIKSVYYELKKKIDADIVLELNDLSPKNFIRDKNQNIIYVDEGGIQHTIKGIGFVKPCLNLFSEKQRKAFLKGYNSILPIDFFDKDYEKFVSIVQSTIMIDTTIKEGRNPKKKYQRSLKILKNV